MLLQMVLREGTSTANQPRCGNYSARLRDVEKQSWELQVSTAERGDTVLNLFSGCSGNFVAIKERILTDVEAKIVLFVGPSGRGSASPVFRVNIKYFK